jgi:CRP-like cAMP-binding protein
MAEGRPRHDRQDHQRDGADALQAQPVRRPCRAAQQVRRLHRQRHGQYRVAEVQDCQDRAPERLQSLPPRQAEQGQDGGDGHHDARQHAAWRREVHQDDAQQRHHAGHVQARDEVGAETVVEIFGAGELFLVPAAILGLPYLASGVALTDLRVLMIPADAFRRGIAEDGTLGRAAIELLARHWRLTVDQVVDLRLRLAERRVARFVARRVPEEAGAGLADLPEAHGAIAARLGMTPETLSRTLNTLETQGAIRLAPRQAHVVDRARLVQIGAR